MEKQIVVFASGTGSNFISIIDKINSKNLNAKVCMLVSNNPKCGAVNFAANNKIDVFIYNSTRFPNDDKQKFLINKLDSYNLDLILLAGYMKKISQSLINRFKNKIMNIHPSLLPLYGGKGFYGLKVHKAVFKNGDKKTGATVHFIDNNYDTGPILIQEQINLKTDETPETIAEKVLEVEHKIYFKALKLFCQNKIYWHNNKPLIKG
tara:strand:- start:11684 stop:12304 length:621 start_codon:yes stop_codon:yes gene_type:complete